MDQYELIRTASRVYKKSIRQIARETGHSRRTVRKALAGVEPKYRQAGPRSCPRMGNFAEVVQTWLRGDCNSPAKQRHTAHRVWQRLEQEHGFGGAESTVRRFVRQCKAGLGMSQSEAVIPLDPEAAQEAEVDWGEAWVRMAGVPRQIKFFCLRSRYSGKTFVRAYPCERQEMFFDAHERAFGFFEGVFPTLVYDNLTTAVRRVLAGKERIEQSQFTAFRAHYTFTARFCNPATGREKGGVEGAIGWARRNFLVPIPEVKDFEQLNALLLERCRQSDTRVIAGRQDRRTVAERHADEQARLLALPQTGFTNEKPVSVRIDRYSTARVDGNRYSVPTSLVGRRLWAHVGCDSVKVYADGKKVAEHARLFRRSRWQLDPMHYLALIGVRIGSFEAARPIRQWRLSWPECYERMLEQLRRRLGDSRGTREFVQILRLHQGHSADRVEQAVTQALQLHTYSYGAMCQLLRPPDERVEFVVLAADSIAGITDRLVAPPHLASYDLLLAGGAR